MPNNEQVEVVDHRARAESVLSWLVGDDGRDATELDPSRDPRVATALQVALSDEACAAGAAVLQHHPVQRAEIVEVRKEIEAAWDAALSPSLPCERCGGSERLPVAPGTHPDHALPCPDRGTGEKQPEPGEGEQGA